MEEKIFEELKRTIKSVIDTQKQNGNWNYNEYMHGMLNGMILIESFVNCREPNFYEAPEEGYLYETKQ